MTENTITMNTINTCSTWTVRDDSPRGVKTVSAAEIKPGDEVVYNNDFAVVIDDSETTADEIKAGRSYDAIVAAIVEYFDENADALSDCLEELDAYNGYLGDDRYYPMDELDEIYTGSEPSEILARAFYGYDENTYNTDSSGHREYGPFNPFREYFTFNGYGNLVSTNYKDYSVHNDRYAVESMFENRAYIDTIDENDELRELFDELEALDADDE